MLPDAISRLPAQALHVFADALSFEVPDPVYLGWDVLHAPIPYALLCWLLALLAPPPSRRLLFGSLLLGGQLHIFVDVLQRHIGSAYRLGYPLTLKTWEAGLFWTEDSIWSIPFLVPLALLGWRYRVATGRAHRAAATGPAARGGANLRA